VKQYRSQKEKKSEIKKSLKKSLGQHGSKCPPNWSKLHPNDQNWTKKALIGQKWSKNLKLDVPNMFELAIN